MRSGLGNAVAGRSLRMFGVLCSCGGRVAKSWYGAGHGTSGGACNEARGFDAVVSGVRTVNGVFLLAL